MRAAIRCTSTSKESWQKSLKKTFKVRSKMTTKKKRAVKKVSVDWSDEDSVKAAMAKSLDVDVEDLSIEDSHMSSFGQSVYKVESGREEYHVVESEEVARDLAIAIVTQDLESEPWNFNQSFIQSHINMDSLRSELMSDVQNSRHEDLAEEAKGNVSRFIKENDLDWPKPSEKTLHHHADVMSDENTSAKEIYNKLKGMDAEDQWTELGDEPEIEDSVIESLAEKQAEDQLSDPLDYLSDIYGKEDAAKKAIEIGGIDVTAAAEEAVSTDGEGHFLSSYDGNMHEGPGGIVYWRTN